LELRSLRTPRLKKTLSNKNRKFSSKLIA